jgi:hypothetical protein
MMFHKVTVWLNGRYTMDRLLSLYRNGIRLQDTMEDINVGRMGMKKEMYDILTHEKDWYLTSWDMINYNAADKIIDIKCSPFLENDKTEYLKITPMGVTIAKISKCPLGRM